MSGNQNNSFTSEQFRKRFEFNWDVMDILVRGKSAIDSKVGFETTTLEEVDRFTASYGYDLENPIEKAEIFGNFHESVSFIRRFFLQPENSDGLAIEVPRKILELTDVRELFLMASMNYPNQMPDTQGLALKSWACSVLKVMHTIAHIDKDLRSPYFAEIQKQIFDRFYRVIHRLEDGKLFLADSPQDPESISLIAFETKPKKTRDSILIKLLHKPENVAEDIFDRVGIRFVTPTRLDSLRVIKYLRDKMIVMPPNIKPSRSRNTLIDFDFFRAELEKISLAVSTGKLSAVEGQKLLEEAAQPPGVDPANPHSSEFYKWVQFTCRQLIKFKNPLYDDIKELKGLVKAKNVSDEACKIIDRMDMKHTPKEVRFFYPFEVQVVDTQSNEENERGRSAHSEYKKAQLQTALRRVMGTLSDVNNNRS